MLNVVHITNPFEAIERDSERWETTAGHSIRTLLTERYPGFTEFEFPTIANVDGEEWMRCRWDEVLPKNAFIVFTRLPGDPITILIGLAIATLVVAVAVVVLFKPKIQKPKIVKPPMPAAIGAFGGSALSSSENRASQNGDPVYSLSGERNQIKPNNVLECAYGRNRIFPAYAALPYNVYAGNNQYQYSLFCLGHGLFDVEALQFEDTPLASFPDIEYEIVDPGEVFTLFHDNVNTSADVANLELFGSNQPEYTGWTTGFVANGPFTKVNRIEIDLALPSGLYSVDPNTGALQGIAAQAKFEYQSVNDFGAPVGSWKPLEFVAVTIVPNKDPKPPRKTQYSTVKSTLFSVTLANPTPQRYTLSAVVEPGRYQVRGMRANPANRSIQAADVLRWEVLRSFEPDVKNYGDVTLVAMKTRASNNLNNNAAAKFNLIATRKLPTWNSVTGWSAPVVTRSPVWAFIDTFKARYGGRYEDTFLDLVDLKVFADTFAEEGITFDYVFDQKSTVWEAARAIARVGRCVPILNGSRITIVRDTPQEFARAVFNQHNIVRDSFSWHIRKDANQTYDGVEVEYIDSETWKLETILCLIDDDLGDFPEPLRLTGCTNRQRAYQEGLYHRALSKWSNETIEFKTGIEGNLPRYGDLVKVSHDLPQWGSGGYIQSIDGHTITLSDPVVFEVGQVHKLVIRKKDGSAYGPFVVTAGSNSITVVATDDIEETFYFDEAHERPLYLFGKEYMESRNCLIAGIKPENRDLIQLQCIPYDDRIYGFGNFTAPPRGAAAVRAIEPSRPIVVDLRVTQIPGTLEFVKVSWPPAIGAKTYLLETSTNGEDWQRVATQPSTIYTLRVEPSYLYMRVAGVNTDIGPWAQWSGRVGLVTAKPGTVQNLRLSIYQPGSIEVVWNALTSPAANAADSYEVSVYSTSSGRFLRRRVVSGLTFVYTLANAVEDALTDTTITIRVKGINIAGISDNPASLALVIPQYNPGVEPTDLSEVNITLDNNVIQIDTV